MIHYPTQVFEPPGSGYSMNCHSTWIFEPPSLTTRWSIIPLEFLNLKVSLAIRWSIIPLEFSNLQVLSTWWSITLLGFSNLHAPTTRQAVAPIGFSIPQALRLFGDPSFHLNFWTPKLQLLDDPSPHLDFRTLSLSGHSMIRHLTWISESPALATQRSVTPLGFLNSQALAT